MIDAATLETGDLARLRDAVASMAPASDDPERISRLRLLEELKSAVAAAQAVEAVAFDRSQRTAQARAGVAARQQGRGVAGQIGLALRISPWRAQRFLGIAHTLTAQLPGTFAELRAGRTSEWRATAVARETSFLSPEHRAEVDSALAPELQGWGDRRVEAEARRAACRLDPQGSDARTRRAETERRVSLRLERNAMCRLSALLPVAQGADDEPAHLDGYGPIPAALGRRLALGTSTDYDTDYGIDAERWIRRLFTAPGSGQLMAMESRRREFTRTQQTFLRLRDATCRTPWCDAPIRHSDHVVEHSNVGHAPEPPRPRRAVSRVEEQLSRLLYSA